MAVFTYRALDSAGSEIHGEMEFPDRMHLLNKLSAMGYHVSSVKEKQKWDLTAILEKTGYSRHRIGRKSRIIFTRQMASLLLMGIPINTALILVAKQTEDDGLIEMVNALKRSIEGGSSVSEALATRRDVFNESYVSMIESGETSGMLAEVFEKLADLEETESERRENVKAAITYPVILLVASLLGIVFLLVAVFPTFVKIFDAANVTLPLATRTVIAVSDFARKNLVFIVAGCASVLLFIRSTGKTIRGRVILDRIKFGIPLAGKLFRKTAITTFAHTLQALNSSGVAVARSLEIASRSAGNSVIEKAVLRARRNIGDGSTIAESFEETGEFPPLFIHMVSIGEESGSLDTMLSKLCEYYEKEITYAVSKLTTAIEPVLIGFMGFLIAFMYLSLITPMMQMMKVAKGGGL